MPATAITPHEPTSLQPSALGTLTMTAADAANGNKFRGASRMVLVAQNSGAGARTLTVTSQPDMKGRTRDITAGSIPAGAFRYLYLEAEGWLDADGNLNVSAEHAEVLLALVHVVR